MIRTIFATIGVFLAMSFVMLIGWWIGQRNGPQPSGETISAQQVLLGLRE